jgi:uncharacterized membrane protein YphA (DoxX/SURF4 family)
MKTLLKMNKMKIRSILLTIFSVVFGLMIIPAGFDKFLHVMPMPEMPEAGNRIMAAFVESKWILPLTGVVEVLAGILFVIPKTRALGAITILPVIVGILLFNIVLSPNTMMFGIVLFFINIWAIIENRHKYLPMIK